MKIKSVFAIALISFAATTLFAKDNPKALGYKSFEVSTPSTGSGTATSAGKSAPVVYFIRDISPEALVKVYNATGYKATGKTGVKVSTGESENSNYLRPALIKNVALLRNASRVFTL